jgi:hypothetical protein
MPKKASEATTTTNGSMGTVSVVDGKSPIRFSSDVAWDIETMPLRSDADDGSLLSAQTARIMTIGYYQPRKDRYVIVYDQDEEAVLRQFWDIFLSLNGSGAKMVGFNIFGFDLPFILKRSWCHGVMVPTNIWSYGNKFCETFVDLMFAWKCGSFKDFISLDSLARFLGVGEKVGSGEKFWKLWQTNQGAALEYLLNDVCITHKCAAKMGMMAQSA